MMSTKIASYTALCAAMLALCPSAAQAQATFVVQFADSAAVLTGEERDALIAHTQEAGRRWASFIDIDGPRSIEIEIAIDLVIPTANAASLTTAFVGVIDGRNTFEQGVAHELRTGVDPNDGAPDARITFGLAYLRNELWFDPDPAVRSAPVPANRTDALSVLLHEFGHVLAYNGWADDQGVPPPDFWSPFDRWMLPGTPTLFEGPVAVAAWGSSPDLTTNNIHHWGNAPEGSRMPPPMARPVLWRDGAPVPHPACNGLVPADVPPSRDADSLAGAGDLIEELMNGVVFFRGQRYDLSALDLGVLADVGIPLGDAPGIFADGFEAAP